MYKNENENINYETNLSIDSIIKDYKEKYLNTNMLPENDFTNSLTNYDYSNDINNNFIFSDNTLIRNIENNENIYISNILNENNSINFYNNLYSLKYKNNDKNIKELYNFILSQSSLNENSNIIKSKQTFIEFMKFLSSEYYTVDKIKDQCGKDINRTSAIFMNDNMLILDKNDDDNNYKICDKFNLEIMKEMNRQNFENIDKIYDYLIYIDILSHQTLINMFIFHVMKTNNINFQMLTTFYHDNSSEISINLFLLIENNKLQFHTFKRCYIYDGMKLINSGYQNAEIAYNNGIEPDGIFIVYVIFDLIKNEYYIKDYLFKFTPEINISNDNNNIFINQNINRENINNENINRENINNENIISKNKGKVAIGSTLGLIALSAIPIALLLGGKTKKYNKIKNKYRKNKQTRIHKKHKTHRKNKQYKKRHTKKYYKK